MIFVDRLRWLVTGVLIGLGLFVSLARAQLRVEPESVDLGKYTQNKIATADVDLVNAGKTQLEILSVGADCSCTAATPDKTSLKPGERTALKIRMETRAFQGEIHRRIVVQTSEGDLAIPVKILIVQFENWSISPFPLVIPPKARGQESSMDVQFDYSGKEGAEIKSIAASPPMLTVKPTIHTNTRFGFTLTRIASAPSGNHNVKLTVETTDKRDPTLEFNVFVPVISNLRVSPSPLVFQTAKVGQPAALRAKLMGWTKAEAPRFEVKGGEIKDLGTDGGDRAFELTLHPAILGAFTQLLRVYDGDELELEIPIILRVEN